MKVGDWFLYVVECSDGTLYTGVTIDVTRRIREHNNPSRGAKYTRSRRPVNLVYHTDFPDRATACKAEAKFKKLSRKQKLEVVNENR